jgi:hypothetical protein
MRLTAEVELILEILFSSGTNRSPREQFLPALDKRAKPVPQRGTISAKLLHFSCRDLHTDNKTAIAIAAKSFAVSINTGPALVTHLPYKQQYFAQTEKQETGDPDSQNFSKGRGSQ